MWRTWHQLDRREVGRPSPRARYSHRLCVLVMTVTLSCRQTPAAHTRSHRATPNQTRQPPNWFLVRIGRPFQHRRRRCRPEPLVGISSPVHVGELGTIWKKRNLLNRLWSITTQTEFLCGFSDFFEHVVRIEKYCGHLCQRVVMIVKSTDSWCIWNYVRIFWT